MVIFRDWLHGALALSILCHVLLIWRLYSAGLMRYRYLAGLLIVELTESLAMLPFSANSRFYGILYFVFGPIVWVFFYLVLIELVRLILEDFPGISGTMLRASRWAVLVAVLVSAGFAVPSIKGPVMPVVLATFVVIQRSVVLAVLILLALILGILFYFRVPLSPNRKLYAVGYGLYFAIGVAGDLLVSELGLKLAPALSLGLMCASSAILLSGVFLLRREGEVVPGAADESEFEKQEREKLYRQLSELNRVLTNVGKASL